MLGAIFWGALSLSSFVIFIAFPSGPSGWNYMVLVPGFLSLTACMLLASPSRSRAARKVAGVVPSVFDDVIAARTEKLKQDKLEQEAVMLRSQSSRRRAARR